VATFETAAEDLAKKIATLDETLDQADHRFDALQKELHDLEEGINQEFSHVMEQAQAFFSKLQEEREALAREVGEAGQKIAQAEGQVAQSRGEAEGELEQAKGQLEALTGSVNGLEPQVESLAAQGAEEPSHAIAQMASQIQTSMQQALDDAQTLLEGDVSDELDQMRHDLEEQVEALKTAVQEAGQEVDQAHVDFTTRVNEATHLVQEQAFEAAGNHIKEVVHYAIEECGKAHQEQIAELTQLSTGLASLLEGLKGELDTARGRIHDEGQEPLHGDMDELTTAVGSAQGALDQVKALLASYTFVQM
jgi:chromosome segregation ATPase